MRIEKAEIKNYKSIVDCEFSFPGYYSAISGKNNAGKSNLLKSLFSFFEDDEEIPFFARSRESKIDFSNDYTQWKDKKERIEIKIWVVISKDLDAGIIRFISAFLGKHLADDRIILKLGKSYERDSIREEVSIIKEEGEEFIDDYFITQEIHKRIRSSAALIFHNSTNQRERFSLRDSFNLFGEISSSHKSRLINAQESLFKTLTAIAQKHKEDIVELMGRLDDKYEVGIAVPKMNFEKFPIEIYLGDKKHGIPLEDWGSGTQNRTKILLSLLQAKKIRESASESDKITPIIVIEEPESFLHPSAQAEFGRVLQDLAQEFEVQVIATTHSPHMLSIDKPNSNLLLCRNTIRNQLRETYLIDTSKSDSWMEPFAIALGINRQSFDSWKDIIFKGSNDELLLVEGEIDKEYFQLLSEDTHSSKKLDLKGEIFAYGGVGFFDNTILLKFLLSRFDSVIVTYDYDADNKVSRILSNLGLNRGEDYFAIGINETGKKDIEGLLPQDINSEVFSDFPELINKALAGDKDAKQKLKREKFNRFKEKATPENGHFDGFYDLTKNLNKAFKKKRN